MEAVKPSLNQVAKKKIIPKEHQTDSSSIKPEPKECKGCGKTIEPKKLFGRWLEQPNCCYECEKDRKTKEYMDEIEQHKKKKQLEKIEQMFKQSKLGERFKKRNFNSFKVNDDNKKAYQMSKKYVDEFEKFKEEGRGILFFGNYGTGKTHLAAAILQEVIAEGYTGIFMSVPELISKIRASWSNETNEGDMIDIISEADLVVMDDLGAENTKDWIKERLFVIINRRYEAMLPTIFTTNCNMEELNHKAGGRIHSRLMEMCKGVKLTGDDYREKS